MRNFFMNFSGVKNYSNTSFRGIWGTGSTIFLKHTFGFAF
jgi:hypothetical protein